MTDRDSFEGGQDATEALGRELEAVREDVRAMVRDEVGRAGMSEADLERLVGELVSREMKRRDANRIEWSVPALAGVGAAVGLVVGLLVGILGYRAATGTPADGPPAAPAQEVATEGAGGSGPGVAGEAGDPGALGEGERSAPGPAAAAPSSGASPRERAALYDSLFDARSDRFDDALGRLEAAGPAAPVLGALSAWRAGGTMDPAQRRRLHDALVQQALNRRTGTALTLDGLVSRDPCRGNSCGALLEWWREGGDGVALPAVPDEPATATDSLAVVERVLVLEELTTGGDGG